eukprot:CAMPEP_0194240200 /NCGR_PEP_ID=MMETSP0158-20130606/6438_1 /TAXON_ID=33649 /ORGANISM="Thalassionema nitzschioides, Strain L26-B" /LENGTH=732 /DNA_ID=CAMNT_0038974853 /DNA_START=41 /DNA_END=2239 /DNA_ORIENTATION=-
MIRKSINSLSKPTKQVLSGKLPSSHSLFQRFLSSSRQKNFEAVDKVGSFIQNFKSKSIDQRILLQQLPNILIELSEAAHRDSGPVVNNLLNEISLETTAYPAKFYALAIEVWLNSGHDESVNEARNLLQELLAKDDNISTKDVEEMDCINSAFARTIHAFLEHHGLQNADSSNFPSDFLTEAALLEQQMSDLHTDESISLSPNTTTMNARLALKSMQTQPLEAMSLLGEMIQADDNGNSSLAPNRVSYNTVIHAFSKEGMLKNATDTLLLMLSRNEEKKSEVKPDVISFNSLLNAYSNIKAPDSGKNAERVLDWMEELSQTEGFEVAPDAYSYTAVINAYAKSRSPERAEMILHRLLQRRQEGYNVSPTVVTFTAVLNAISQLSHEDARPARASSVMALMEELHLTGTVDMEPSVVTYNALLNVWKSCRRHPDAPKEVIRILQSMKLKSAHARPNTKTYNIILATLAKANANYVQLAEGLLDEMNNTNDATSKPNSVTYNSFLNVLANSKQESVVLRAFEIFGYMKQNINDGEETALPTTETYNVMMKVASNCMQSGGAACAEEILEELESLYLTNNGEIRPTVVSYISCLKAWSRDTEREPKKLVHAHKLIERMNQSYISGNKAAKPVTAVYNTLLSCYKNVATYVRTRDDQIDVLLSLSRLLDEMRQSKDFRPDQITYVTILKTLKRLPIQDERTEGVMRRIVNSCQEEGQLGKQMLNAVKKVCPWLLNR